MLISSYNALGDGRYYDVETQSSFDFDHASGKASAVQSHVLESRHEDLVYVVHGPIPYTHQSPVLNVQIYGCIC